MNESQILLAKIETTEGTDAAPDGTDVILTTGGIDVSVYEGNTVSREVDSVQPKNSVQINTGPYSTWSAKCDAAGSGDSAKPPAFGVLLQACGFNEVKDATVGSEKVTYTLSHAESKTVTLYRFLSDLMVQKSFGCRGALQLSFSGDSLPLFEFSNFMGSYNRPATANFPNSLTYDDHDFPLPFTKENTPTFTIDGYAFIVENLTINFGQDVQYLNLPNFSGTRHGTAKPSGSATVIAPTLDQKNLFEKQESHNGITVIPLDLVHGLTKGNRLKVNSPKIQIFNVKEGSNGGLVTLSFDFNFIDSPTIIFD